MLDKPQRPWSATDAAELYHLDRWGRQFFGLDKDGFMTIKRDSDEQKRLRIIDVVNHFTTKGFSPPMIVRFPGIIQQRATQINRAFQSAINSYGFEGKYQLFYPVKVNQHHEVISAAVDAVKPYGGGLEAGSKAELLAVIAMAGEDTPLLCNGFKDRTVVEMALRAAKLGRDITIVIEKPTEIDLILRLATSMNVRPKLGIRVKLSSKGGGHWSSSGGSKSKFGLSIPELTVGVKQIEQAGFIDCVHLLHFHPGSQISNVRKIKSALTEVARIYVNLIEHGVPIKTIDVGGGLAVDYTGNRNKDLSSMNYTLREYANDVVYQIQIVCDETGTPHPNIYSESGRALMAHHSMLVVPVIGTSHTNLANLDNQPNSPEVTLIDQENSVDPSSHPALRELTEIYKELTLKNLLESFHDAQSLIERTLQLFSNGGLDIWHRSYAERMGWAICMKINSLLGELDFVPRDLEQLRTMLADTYFGNFSVFQALPDAWALKQLFPMMPIHRLDERPTQYGVLGDITCDSDGKIDCFVGNFGDRDTLPLHRLNDDPYYLGIFLIGAYQEALSDDHNLMGKFHIVTVVDPDDPASWQCVPGSTLDDVLEHVHYDTDQIQRNITGLIDGFKNSDPGMVDEAEEHQTFFRALSDSYTYLTGD